MKTLELHYPMIQFLIKCIMRRNLDLYNLKSCIRKSIETPKKEKRNEIKNIIFNFFMVQSIYTKDIYTSYATLSSGISWRAYPTSHLYIFWYKHKPLGECVYQKIQVTSGIFHGYTTRKGYITIL